MRTFAIALLLLGAAATQGSAQQTRKPPYWASIAASHAMMRTGPGKEYPAVWEYRREDLPIRVVEIYKNWRRIADPGGTVGWMQVNLLSDTRTALVVGPQNRPLHDKPEEGAAIRYYAEPGVVGRITDCGPSWCRFDVKSRGGYIQVSGIYGLDSGENF